MSDRSNDCLKLSAGFKRTFEGSRGLVCYFARFTFSSFSRGIRGLFYSLRFLNNIIYRDFLPARKSEIRKTKPRTTKHDPLTPTILSPRLTTTNTKTRPCH